MSIEIRGVTKTFGAYTALREVSVELPSGELVALLGPSGSGKTTLLRVVAGLETPDEGRVLFDGVDATDRHARQRGVGFVFQHYALFRHMTVFENVAFGLRVRPRASRLPGAAIRQRVRDLLALVQMEGLAHRYPSQLSGGQRQRVGIARALAMEPALVICDEPVSALDVSIQAQIINLLEDLQRELDLTYLFVAHDLSVVRHISDRVAVMYLGRIVELADRKALYEAPVHPYTRALLSAVPIPDPELETHRERIVLGGEVPSSLNPPPGCVFHPRCPIAVERCSREVPVLREVRPGQWGACHLA